MSVNPILPLLLLLVIVPQASAVSANKNESFGQTLPNATKGLLYPRESESREVRSLDGLWYFLPTNESLVDKVLASNPLEGKLKNKNNTLRVPVPSSYNDLFTEREIQEYVGVVSYERYFFVPKDWNLDKRVWLRFGSVHYYAIVWLNGEMLVRHEMGHLPFEVDATHVLRFGAENRLTVFCDNRLTDITIPQGILYSFYPTFYTKPHDNITFQVYQFDFFNYAGIHRSVVLYTTPTVHLKDVHVNTDLLTNNTVGLLQYDIHIDKTNWNNTEKQRMQESYYVRLQVRDRDGVLAAKAISKPGDHFEGEFQVEKVHPWWPYLMNPEYGYLYTLEIYLHSMNNNLLDVYRMKVGFRSLKMNQNSLLMNGKPLYLRGFGRHEDMDIHGRGFDLPLLIRDFNLIKWIGANAYRTTHYPYSEESMQLADENGIMIIDECPAVSISTVLASNDLEVLLSKHQSAMEQMIHRDRNHPSVIMWSLANEPQLGSKYSDIYFGKLVEYVKSLDKIRPITMAINNFNVAQEFIKHLDVISFNRYNAWYHNPGMLHSVVPEVIFEVTFLKMEYNRPILITEYGAGALLDYHTLPSTMWSQEYQNDVLRQHFKAFDILRDQNLSLIGEMIWNFADFQTPQDVNRAGGNRKGLFTRNRQPKSSAFLTRQRYFALCKLLDSCVQPKNLEQYIAKEPKHSTQ